MNDPIIVAFTFIRSTVSLFVMYMYCLLMTRLALTCLHEKYLYVHVALIHYY